MLADSVNSGESEIDKDLSSVKEFEKETESLVDWLFEELSVFVKDNETEGDMVPETDAETENVKSGVGLNESVFCDLERVGGGENVFVFPESEPETDLSMVSETVTVGLDSVSENERVLSAVFVSEKLLVGVGGGVTVYVAVISSVSDFETVRLKEMESSGDQETDADSSGVPVPAQRRDRLKDRVGVGGGVFVYVRVRSAVSVSDLERSPVSLMETVSVS